MMETREWNSFFTEGDWEEGKISLKDEKVSTLVFSSGGINGLLQLGALYEIVRREDYKDLLDKVKNFYGTSVGSIISYLLSIGFSPLEILMNINSSPLSLGEPDLKKLIFSKSPGAFLWKPIEDRLKNMTLKKMKFIPTFKDVYDTFKKKLTIVVYNKSKEKTEYLSIENHGEMVCLDAIKMSSAIPFIFETCRYRGDVYIDGAISDPFAIQTADKEIPIEEMILGFNVRYKKHIDFEPTNILLYSMWILSTPLEVISEEKIKNLSKRCKILSLETESSFMPNVESHIEKVLEKFDKGVKISMEKII